MGIINVEWNEFKPSAISAFRNLECDEHFTDVTLASEDGGHVKAHKVVLSSCSAFFKDILIQHPHPFPLIYLSSVDMEDLNFFIKFIYTGEAPIDEDKLGKSMETLKRFKVKGLEEDVANANNDDPNTKVGMKDSQSKVNNVSNLSGCLPDIMVTRVINSEPKKCDLDIAETGTEPETELVEKDCKVEEANIEQVENKVEEANQIKSDLDDLAFLSSLSLPANQCDICYKVLASPSSVSEHKLAIHEGFKFPCDLCTVESSSKRNLRRHMQIHNTKSANTKASINSAAGDAAKETEYQFMENMKRGNLNVGKERLDENIKMKTTHKNTRKSALTQAVEARVMELIETNGEMLTCIKCTKTVHITRKWQLYKHAEIHIDGLEFPCNMCDNVSKTSHSLVQHRYSKHSKRAAGKNSTEED
jgi:hypothetical protein